MFVSARRITGPGELQRDEDDAGHAKIARAIRDDNKACFSPLPVSPNQLFFVLIIIKKTNVLSLTQRTADLETPEAVKSKPCYSLPTPGKYHRISCRGHA